MPTGDFDEVRNTFNASRGEAAAAALCKRGIDGRYFRSADDAVAATLEIIPSGSRVGVGGSVTVQEVGILGRLEGRGDQVVRHVPEMELEESLRVRRDAVKCPYFLCSSNAITMDGELVNVDGIGNRVAGMIFGPDVVVALAGVNKLVADREEALSRVKNVAAPANATRMGLDLPCVEKGMCVSCRSPMSICRVTTIISMKPIWTDLKVFIIGEQLGL